MPDDLDVLLVVGPTTGGIGRHVHALAGGLITHGHRVTVVGPAVTEELFGWSALGAAFHPAPVGSASPQRLSMAVRAVGTAGAAASVVHAHGARAGAVAALAKSRPLVVTWHNTR